MHNNWSSETWLQIVFLPKEIIRVQLITLEKLGRKLLLISIILAFFFNVCLFFSSTFGLILKVKADRLLEIALDSTALVLTSESIHNFDINLRTVKRAISMVKSPRTTKTL